MLCILEHKFKLRHASGLLYKDILGVHVTRASRYIMPMRQKFFSFMFCKITVCYYLSENIKPLGKITIFAKLQVPVSVNMNIKN